MLVVTQYRKVREKNLSEEFGISSQNRENRAHLVCARATRESSNWSESICRSLSGGFRTTNCIRDQYIFVVLKKIRFNRLYYLTICLEKKIHCFTPYEITTRHGFLFESVLFMSLQLCNIRLIFFLFSSTFTTFNLRIYGP